MSDITDILSLLGGERVGDDGRYDMASTTQNNCHNYSLAGSSTCLTGVEDITLYIEIPAFEPIEYVKTKRKIETGDSEEITTWSKVEPRVKFTITGSMEVANLFNQLALHESIQFTNIPDAVIVTVRDVEVEYSPYNDHFRIEVSLLLTESSIISTLCCGSYYEDAPFNECDGTGETGDPNNDPGCVDYDVSIALTAGPPDELTASSTGGDTGTETFTWYLDGEYFGEGATIQPTLPGVYRVDAQKGNCTDSESYTYSGDCGGFDVTIEEIILSDGGSALVALPNMTADLQWEEFNDPDWDEIPGETSNLFEPESDGTYRVVATSSGGCEATSDSIEVELPTDCTDLFTLEIANNSGELEVTIVDYAGVDTPDYTWYQDTGDGPVLIDGAASETLDDLTPGYYIVTVELDGCTQSASIVVGCDFETVSDDCGCGDSSAWSETFVASGGETAFAVSNFFLADPLHVGVNEMMATYLVTKNGVSIGYVSGTPADGEEWSVDYTDQEITLAAGTVLEDDVFVIRKLRCIKL